jgi:glycosyltransferase involved in cell wall biosynthesis
MKLRVVMTTYNQERFIAQAIESVLMQQVDFEFEVVIIEDFSTDRTRQIVLGYQQKKPRQIKLVLSDRNRNDSRNFAHAIETAESQYIALLEGDDYWTSPHKLQKQVDFLDQHPECAVCFHNALMHFDNEVDPPRPFNPADQKAISSLDDLLPGNFLATCSVVFRQGLFEKFPEWFFTLPFGDWPLHILNAQHGKIGYIDEMMSVYRVHSNGLWSRLNPVERMEKINYCLETIRPYLDNKHSLMLHRLLMERYYRLSLESEERGDWREAKNNLEKFIDKYTEMDITNPSKAFYQLKLLRLRLKLWLYQYPGAFRRFKHLVDFIERAGIDKAKIPGDGKTNLC